MMVTEHKNVRSAQVASSYVEAILGNTVITAFAQDIERLRQVAPTITLDEVNREALAWRSKENRIILVDMPEKAGFQRPTEAALLATVDAAAQRTMAAYTEQTVDAQLLPALPTPGAVVSEKKYPSVGITEWRLSNGLRVLLKPTDFRADQIGVVGTSLGGYQSLPDSDYMTGRLMELVIGHGGYGQFSANELRKLLSGKIVSVRQQVDAGSESISGSSSNADLETLFQLFHLAITSPRYDSVAIASSIDNARISLENRNANSMVPFGDSINAIMTQSHPKLTPITVQSLDSINPRRAIEILKERFSNIDDFTFMIVGSFVPDSIKPYVTRYLGSLPATGRFESVPDIGVRTPTGIITRTFYGGTEPRATTILNFKGDYPKHSLDVMSELTMLQQILETRLRERLREQMGATYNVSVRSAVQVEPTATYDFTINFVSDPGRVDEMIAAVFDVVGKFKREGPTASEVKNSVEMMLRDAETSQKTNDFWYGILEYDRRGWAYDQMVSNDRWTRMTPKIVKEAAVRYLNQNSYTQFTLKPVQSAPAAGRGSTSGQDGSK